MIKFIVELWKYYRRRYCPLRIYKYGKLGLSVFDDRTMLEKYCDYVDTIVTRLETYAEDRSRKSKQVWHSFYDISTGQYITSSKQIDDICKKQGLEFMRPDEIKSEADRYYKMKQADSERMIKKDLTEIVQNVKRQKKSYVREIRRDITAKKYHTGAKDTFH